MPLFGYECQECNARFEQLEYGRSDQVAFPKCGREKVKRLLSVFAVSASSSPKASADAGPCCACSPEQPAMCQN